MAASHSHTARGLAAIASGPFPSFLLIPRQLSLTCGVSTGPTTAGLEPRPLRGAQARDRGPSLSAPHAPIPPAPALGAHEPNTRPLPTSPQLSVAFQQGQFHGFSHQQHLLGPLAVCSSCPRRRGQQLSPSRTRLLFVPTDQRPILMVPPRSNAWQTQ